MARKKTKAKQKPLSKEFQQMWTAVKLTLPDCPPVDGSVKICPQCGALAVVEMTPAFIALQPDNTTHVCLPFFNGCNQGYGR